jgi:hypothetical protein
MEVSDNLRDALLSMGIDPATLGHDPEEDLTMVPRDQWQEGTKITPPAAILRYLQSGDRLTNHTLDMMEIAMEKAANVSSPWAIASLRRGKEEEGTLTVVHFELIRED